MLMRRPESLGIDYSAIKRKLDADWLANESIWNIQKSEAAIDTRLEAGDSTLISQLMPGLPYNNQNNIYFNRVRPLLSQVSGHQRRNRKSTPVVPLENADQKTADQQTKIVLNIYKKTMLDEIISDAFHQGACITGMNLIQIYLDFTEDPVFGELKFANLPYNAFYVDPNIRKTDLTDARFIRTRTYVTAGEAALLLPEYYDEIMSLSSAPSGMAPDEKFQYLAESYGQSLSNVLAYDEHYYRDYTMQKRLIDKRTGEFLDITNTHDKYDIRTFLRDNPTVRLLDQQIPTVRMAIEIQNKIFYDGPNPLGIHEMPFVMVTGYFNPGIQFLYERFQGLARSMRSPQMLLNRRIVLNMDIAESLINSGYIFKEDAIKDVKNLYQTGPGRMIPVKKGFSPTDIQPIPPINIPPAFFQIQETMQNLFPMVSGITEENMGFEVDDKSGYARALSQGAGQTTLQPLFDRLDHAQIQLTEKILKVVKANYGPSKIKAMLGGEEEPTAYFYNKTFGKYHVMIELGYNTESQQQMQFAQLLKLKEMGVPIPNSSLIEAASIQKKGDLIKAMEAEQKSAQEQQQQQTQVQQQLMQMQAEATHAKAQADYGLYAERASRIPENRAFALQRLAEANKDDESAALDKIKAIKELQDIDIAQLERLIAIAQMMKADEVAQRTPQGEQQQQNTQEPSQPMQQEPPQGVDSSAQPELG